MFCLTCLSIERYIDVYMIPRPSPAFYLTSLIVGYWYGMNSNGAWTPLIWMLAGFFIMWGIIKLGRVFFNMFY